MPLVTICVFMICCKSPAGSDNSESATTDTTYAAIDTFVVAADITETDKTKMMEIQKPLTLVIKNLASATAPVTVSVYGTENKFPVAKNELKIYKLKPHRKVLTAKITDLKYGTYALATYQDVNKNGKIDQNFIGVPKEPYAFSQNYKPTIKAPNFDDCKFEYNEKNNIITINMIR